jgi:hypothetical protein
LIRENQILFAAAVPAGAAAESSLKAGLPSTTMELLAIFKTIHHCFFPYHVKRNPVKENRDFSAVATFLKHLNDP